MSTPNPSREELARRVCEGLYINPTSEMQALVRAALDRTVPEIPSVESFGAKLRTSIWDRMSPINGKPAREVILLEPALRDPAVIAVIVQDISEPVPRTLVLQPVNPEEYPTPEEQFFRAVWAYRYAARMRRDGAVMALVQEKIQQSLSQGSP